MSYMDDTPTWQEIEEAKYARYCQVPPSAEEDRIDELEAVDRLYEKAPRAWR